MANSTTAFPDSTVAQNLTPLQIFSTIIFICASSVSLAAYTLVLIILFLYFKEFKSNFYYLVISLALVDMAFLALVLFYVVPCTILQTNVWISWAPGFTESFSYITECTHLTYIGFNRLTTASIFISKSPKLEKVFNSRRYVFLVIGFLWATGPIIPAIVELAGCRLEYDYVYMAFNYKCHVISTAQYLDQVMLGDNVVSGLLPSLIAASHLLTWCVVYFKGKQSGAASNEIVQQRKRERRLLVQFTLISLTLILYYASFWIIPYWFAGNPGLVLITFFGIASTAVNPFTYLAFNRLMKAKAKYLIFTVVLRRKNEVHDGGTNAPTRSIAHGIQTRSVNVVPLA